MATQGRNAHNQWVKKYRMQYSDDGVNFNFYQTPGQNFPKVHCSNMHVLYFPLGLGLTYKVKGWEMILDIF